jgi:hypothetical protein
MSGTDAISAKILDYLKNNFKAPDAMDAKAVADWWQGIQDIDQSLDGLTLALEGLVEAGAIEKQELSNDIFYYKVS